MKKQLLLTILISLFSLTSSAQVEFRLMGSLEDKLTYPLTKFSNTQSNQGRIRYSSQTNLVLKGHLNFANNLSFSVNTGIFNHGFSHLLNDTLIVKQRAYVVPLGGQFTIGKIVGKNFFIGGEVQIPIHYKEKNWVKGEKKNKVKFSEFGSNHVMNLAPMVFIGFQFNDSRYVQLKYQLDNFINPNHTFNFRGINTRITESTMVELSFGTLLNFGKLRALKGLKELNDMNDVEIEI